MPYVSILFLCLLGVAAEADAFHSKEDCEMFCTGDNDACHPVEGVVPTEWLCSTGIVKRDTIRELVERIMKRCVREDACESSPCLFDGACHRRCESPGYMCTCADGYTGTICEIPPPPEPTTTAAPPPELTTGQTTTAASWG